MVNDNDGRVVAVCDGTDNCEESGKEMAWTNGGEDGESMETAMMGDLCCTMVVVWVWTWPVVGSD